MLDVPIGTVMSRLHRGRKALQKSLGQFAEERGLLPRSSPPVLIASETGPDSDD